MNRTALLACALLVSTTRAAAQDATAPITQIANAFPADVKAYDYVTMTRDQRFVYYIASVGGGVWLYDRATKAKTKLAEEWPWDLTLAPNGAALAWTKQGENNKGEFVWVLPLNPSTGSPTGPARRVSTIAGDVPSISPDGKWIAFARDERVASNQTSFSGRTLMVLPLAGGPERALHTATEADLGLISWTPDSKAIYFGVNSPRPRRGIPGSIKRVSIDGGRVSTVVAAVSQDWPGLSPDGKTIIYRDTGLTGRMVVVDTTGKRLSSFVLPPYEEIVAWLTTGSLLVRNEYTQRQIHVFSLADGTTRRVTTNASRVFAPAWSPDGKRISYLERIGGRAQLVAMDPQGGNRRTYPLLDQYNAGNWWSPDGRWIAYRAAEQEGGRISSINAVEVSTGREVVLQPVKTSEPWRWSLDSKSMFLTQSNPPLNLASPPAERRTTVHQAGLDGTSRVVYQATLPGNANPMIVQDTLILTVGHQTAATTIAPLRGGGGRSIELMPNQGFVSAPGFSPDGQWIAFRRTNDSRDNRDMRILEVMKLDGSSRVTVNLPFAATSGIDRPQFLPGNREVLISDSTALYRLTLQSGQVTKLFSLREQRNSSPHYVLSPDGRTVLYTTVVDVPITLSRLQLSSILPKR